MSYTSTIIQRKAWSLIGGPAKHVLLVGGSRSGKTFIILRSIAMRAMAASESRHAVLRFRFNHVKSSIVLDTWPKMMRLCFPECTYTLDKTDWYVTFPNGSQVWFGGLDDKERTEKILGQEYATIFFNECSQIPLSAKNMALTRLAQRCDAVIGKEPRPLRLKAIYDENPPSQAHWTYKQFVRKLEPDSGKPLADQDNYAWLAMNPVDNIENLPPDYLKELEALPVRMRQRFLEGKFADVTAGALWNVETIDKHRTSDGPVDLLRVVVAVDPSGSDDIDNLGNDEIGIVVAGLGIDGKAYILEDCTVKAGPATWGRVAVSAYERHAADLIVAEKNFGGAMVKFVIKSAGPDAKCELISASRGKCVRAEPISALSEQGKIMFAGSFPDLEEELCGMTTQGYIGEKSPNRADAFVWAVSKLFPGIVKEKKKEKKVSARHNMPYIGATGWMGV